MFIGAVVWSFVSVSDSGVSHSQLYTEMLELSTYWDFTDLKQLLEAKLFIDFLISKTCDQSYD